MARPKVPSIPIPAEEAWEAELDEAEDTLILPSELDGAGSTALPAIAPEVSAALAPDRLYVARGTLPPSALVARLTQAVQVAQMQRGDLSRTWLALRAEWMPLLRQAVEQAGGDGLDAHLRRLLRPPGVAARDPLVGELRARMRKLNHAKTAPALVDDAMRTVRLVERWLQDPARAPISLDVLERDLEGRLDVGEVLTALFAASSELRQKAGHVRRILESLREQVRHRPGALYQSFSRLKLELRVIDAELERRQRSRRARP